jgi:hypothetical protein
MNWLGNLAGFLPGAQDLSEQDRMALIRQGLLAAGSGILANNQGNYGKAGPAIGAGLSQGLLAINKGAGDLADRKRQAQMLALQTGDPAELRVFNKLTEGLSPEDRQQALRVHLGLDARPSSAGFKQFSFKDAMGRDHVGVMNGRTGRIDTPEGLSFDPSAVTPTDYTVDPSLPQPVKDAIAASEASGKPLPPTIDLAPAVPRPSPTAGSGAFVGPTPGKVAYDQEAAKRQAGLDYSPAQGVIDAQNAGMATTATERAKTTTEAQRNLPKTIQAAEISLDTINKLRNHPGLSIITGMSGVVDPRNYLRGTDAQGAQALADQIKGQTFLQAYQTLRGGGQITEVEGQKATDAMGRLNRAQSESDYRAALDDLAQVIQSGLERARAQAGQSNAGHDPLGIMP